MITEGEAEFCSENPDVYAVNDALHCSLSMVVDLESRLQNLDALLLTGRPNAIADAAKAMELSLSAAEPTFQSVVLALETLGADRLQDAAMRLRRCNQQTAAAAAEHLRTALRRFVKRNDLCHRRALSLGRGLSASVRTLHALGLAGNGRLIAEA
jgi:hypothetical protein